MTMLTETTIVENPMSSSLLTRNVYCVCFTQRDSSELFHGELAQARKSYFSDGQKTVRVGKAQIVKGFEGKLSGKISRRGFYWRKQANRVNLEESFHQKGGYVVIMRDFSGFISARLYFDKEHNWIKSEYYNPEAPSVAQVIFKPSGTSDAVERFDWNPQTKCSLSTMLYPVSYLPGTAEQSLINARFGEPQLILYCAEGEFCYCPKEEAKQRLQALAEIGEGALILMPAWEVKDGLLAGEENTNQGPAPSFTGLEAYAKVEPSSPQPTSAAETVGTTEADTDAETADTIEADTAVEADTMAEPVVSLDTVSMTEVSAEFSVPPSPPPTEEPLPETPPSCETMEEQADREKILSAAEQWEQRMLAAQADLPLAPPQEEEVLPAEQEDTAYRHMVVNGQLAGRGRTEQPGGLTIYDGEFRDGKREGFGSYYYKDGGLCYAGFWKDDKKDGLGVSFRDNDRALHITNWKDGEPGNTVSLFDSEGNLRFSGRMENGKKQGVGVSYNCEDGTVFVGRWENGEETGMGSSFDRDGTLLYTGGWKDGKRCGHGTEFDQDGGIIFDGEWQDGKYYNGILYKKPAAPEEEQQASL